MDWLVAALQGAVQATGQVFELHARSIRVRVAADHAHQVNAIRSCGPQTDAGDDILAGADGEAVEISGDRQNGVTQIASPARGDRASDEMESLFLSARPRESGDPGSRTPALVTLDSRLRGNERNINSARPRESGDPGSRTPALVTLDSRLRGNERNINSARPRESGDPGSRTPAHFALDSRLRGNERNMQLTTTGKSCIDAPMNSHLARRISARARRLSAEAWGLPMR